MGSSWRSHHEHANAVGEPRLLDLRAARTEPRATLAARSCGRVVARDRRGGRGSGARAARTAAEAAADRRYRRRPPAPIASDAQKPCPHVRSSSWRPHETPGARARPASASRRSPPGAPPEATPWHFITSAARDRACTGPRPWRSTPGSPASWLYSLKALARAVTRSISNTSRVNDCALRALDLVGARRRVAQLVELLVDHLQRLVGDPCPSSASPLISNVLASWSDSWYALTRSARSAGRRRDACRGGSSCPR